MEQDLTDYLVNRNRMKVFLGAFEDGEAVGLSDIGR